MKMTPEHYAEVQTKILQVIETFPSVDDYRKKFETKPKLDYEMIRRWDLLFVSKPGPLINQLYKYLNDNNIDTALKKIVAEYERSPNARVI